MVRRRRFRAIGFEHLEDRGLLSSGLIHTQAAVGIKGLEQGGGRLTVQGDPQPSPTTPMPRFDPLGADVHTRDLASAAQGNASVVFLGDSITYNWGSADRVAVGSPVWDSQ